MVWGLFCSKPWFSKLPLENNLKEKDVGYSLETKDCLYIVEYQTVFKKVILLLLIMKKYFCTKRKQKESTNIVEYKQNGAPQYFS